MDNKNTVFEILNDVNVNKFTEQKNGLTYLTWSKAWEEVKKRYSSATYRVVKDPNTGLPYFKEDGVGYMVMTEVTVEGDCLEMWLPVMDFKNRAMLEPTMTDINKTVMRCLAKNLAMFGLGLYVYAGQDLPSDEEKPTPQTKAQVEKIYIDKKKQDALMKKCEDDNVHPVLIIDKCHVDDFSQITEKQFAWICANWSKEFKK